MSRKIKLYGKAGLDKFATVDAIDFDWLNQWRWHFRDGYAARTQVFTRVNGKQPSEKIWMHRLINKTPKGMETDHINRDRLDNRRENLRAVTKRQNAMNRNMRVDNKSGYIGVCWDKDRNKWVASLSTNDKTIHLGRYEDIVEAAKAYDQAAEKHYGEYAHLNFPRASL